MQENQNENQETELSLEEKLQNANMEVEKLIQDLKNKQNEYAQTLDDLNSQKDKINEILSEINTTKQAFIDDINNKLEEYETKFDAVSSEITDFKTSTEKTFSDLDTQYNNLVEKYKIDAEENLEEIKSKVSEVTDILNKEQENFDEFVEDNKKDYTQKYTEITNLVTKYNTLTTESLTNIEKREKVIIDSQSKIEKIEADCQIIKTSITEYITNMNAKTKEIDEKTKKFEEDTQSIITKNEKQTEEIDRQLELATGVGLFSSFHKRKTDLENGQWIWLALVIVSIIILIGFSCWLVGEIQKIDWKNVNWFVDIILKGSVSLPVLYLVAFVTDRYTKERRLLEEYAFKSTISLALKPYFDMVCSCEITDAERQFLIKSIENIFVTPTDKVYRTKECQNKIDISHLTELTESVKQLENKINEGK